MLVLQGYWELEHDIWIHWELSLANTIAGSQKFEKWNNANFSNLWWSKSWRSLGWRSKSWRSWARWRSKSWRSRTGWRSKKLAIRAGGGDHKLGGDQKSWRSARLRSQVGGDHKVAIKKLESEFWVFFQFGWRSQVAIKKQKSWVLSLFLANRDLRWRTAFSGDFAQTEFWLRWQTGFQWVDKNGSSDLCGAPPHPPIFLQPIVLVWSRTRKW